MPPRLWPVTRTCAVFHADAQVLAALEKGVLVADNVGVAQAAQQADLAEGALAILRRAMQMHLFERAAAALGILGQIDGAVAALAYTADAAVQRLLLLLAHAAVNNNNVISDSGRRGVSRGGT